MPAKQKAFTPEGKHGLATYMAAAGDKRTVPAIMALIALNSVLLVAGE